MDTFAHLSCNHTSFFPMPQKLGWVPGVGAAQIKSGMIYMIPLSLPLTPDYTQFSWWRQLPLFPVGNQSRGGRCDSVSSLSIFTFPAFFISLPSSELYLRLELWVMCYVSVSYKAASLYAVVLKDRLEGFVLTFIFFFWGNI